jgi:ABC-type sugar transport system substrate-binding protein
LLRLPISLLIVSPNEVAPPTPIVEEAYKKGIPVIIMERRTASHIYTAYVGADNYEVGRKGNDAEGSAGEKIKLIGVDGLPGTNEGVDFVAKGLFNATILYPRFQKREEGWVGYQTF